MTIYIPSTSFLHRHTTLYLLLSALKWSHTRYTVLQLLYYFPGSVMFNLAHVGVQYYTFIILLEGTLSTY